MEKFFKPVHSPSTMDQVKPRKSHQHHHHQLHHHRDPHLHRYTMFDDADRNTDDNHGQPRHHHQGHYLHDSPHHNAHHHHQAQQFHQSEEDDILFNYHTPVTLSRASSSSLSSSSSSFSSSSWYTEASTNDPFYLHHAERPQHSLSCSNISDARRGFQEDDSSEPIIFATVKHGKKGSVCSEIDASLQQKGKRGFSSLDRGHSRSDEGLLQGTDSDLRAETSRVSHMSYGPLYKTASLNRSLAFSEEDVLLGVSRGPKRAVSSSQLPSKGILKKNEPHIDIRKAKSMEVLSPRVSKDGSRQKGKGTTQAEIEQARSNFVQGKLQFSAFLDEITKQVISPSDLTILGVHGNKTTVKSPVPAQKIPSPVKPQLPPKKHRENLGGEGEQHLKQHSRLEEAVQSSSRKHSDCSVNSDKLISYAGRNSHGSPPPHHHPQSANRNANPGSNRKDRRPSPTGGSVSGHRYGRCGPHLTDGTSTSPEPSLPKQHHHHHKQQPTASQSPHCQQTHQHPPKHVHPGSGHQGPTSSPPSSAHGTGASVGSESSSTKSDSSKARDTASTATSHSSELSGQHHSQHVGHSKQYRDTLCDAEHVQALQDENADLHQNLLQTVVCIESLEAELQRTRDELSKVKEKYKSLLETHTGTKEANSLLGEHLHIASESLCSERKYLLNQVSRLSSELEDAHRTIAALENINVPCLIKDLLEKHFDSAESIQKLLMASAPVSHSAISPQGDGQSHTPKMEEAAYDWSKKPEAGLQRVTAFMPFKHELPPKGVAACLSNQNDSSHSPPFSVADISTAIYKKMADSYAARPQPRYPPSQQQPVLGTDQTETPPNLQHAHVGGDSWGGKARVQVTLLEHDIVDVTSKSAQQILDDFMQQLQAHKEVGGGTEPQGGQERVGGAEEIGRAKISSNSMSG